MKENLILQTKFEIDSSQTDMFARLKLSGLVNLLIQSAIKSADSLGFGFKNLKEQNLLWVLSRLNIELYKPLKWYDVSEVETWPKNIEKIFYLRDFIVRDQKANIVAKATSAWLAIDYQSRRPKKLNAEQTKDFTLLKDKHAIEELPTKLIDVCGSEAGLLIPNYFDFDLNGHVTTTRYVDWMMDSFSFDFHKNHYPTKLAINFLKEIVPEETISLIKRFDEKDYLFEGINKENYSAAFRGSITF